MAAERWLIPFTTCQRAVGPSPKNVLSTSPVNLCGDNLFIFCLKTSLSAPLQVELSYKRFWSKRSSQLISSDHSPTTRSTLWRTTTRVPAHIPRLSLRWQARMVRIVAMAIWQPFAFCFWVSPFWCLADAVSTCCFVTPHPRIHSEDRTVHQHRTPSSQMFHAKN